MGALATIAYLSLRLATYEVAPSFVLSQFGSGPEATDNFIK